jgi:hypothetical protein
MVTPVSHTVTVAMKGRSGQRLRATKTHTQEAGPTSHTPGRAGGFHGHQMPFRSPAPRLRPSRVPISTSGDSAAHSPALPVRPSRIPIAESLTASQGQLQQLISSRTHCDELAPVALSTAGHPLEPGVRGALEARYGHGLGHVRVHDDPDAGAAVRGIGALAFTHGAHVAFAPGMYEPNSFEGRQLLTHELAHVLQQSEPSAGSRRAADTETEANRAAGSILRSAKRVTISARSAPALMAQKERPARGSTVVSLIVISLAGKTIQFHTDTGTFTYSLTESDVEVGEYSAQVGVKGGGEKAVLQLILQEAPGGLRFQFNYSIAEGQVNPATFFAGQRSVHVSVREGAGGGGAEAGEESPAPPATEAVGPSVATATEQGGVTPPVVPGPGYSGVPTVTVTDLVQLQKLKQGGLLDAKTATRIEGRIQSAEALTFQDAIDLLQALQQITDTGSPQEQQQAQQSWVKWARFIQRNKDKLTGQLAAASGGRTVEEIDALIAKHGGYATVATGTTSESIPYDLERAKSWNALAPWEKDLWKELERQHPELLSTDPGASKDLHLYGADLMRMGLRLSPRYMKGGGQEALEQLFNDPWFWAGTFAGVMLYISAWAMPEPIISKATAASITTALLIVFSGSEIKNLIVAWINLMDETRSARSLKAVETAAEHFGKSVGGTLARVLVMLIQLVGGKLLPTPTPPSGGGLVPAPATAGAVGRIPMPAVPAIPLPVSAGGFGALGPTHVAMTRGPKGTETSQEPIAPEPKGGGKSVSEGEPAKTGPEEAPVDYSKLSNEELRARALTDPRAAEELISRESSRAPEAVPTPRPFTVNEAFEEIMDRYPRPLNEPPFNSHARADYTPVGFESEGSAVKGQVRKVVVIRGITGNINGRIVRFSVAYDPATGTFEDIHEASGK